MKILMGVCHPDGLEYEIDAAQNVADGLRLSYNVQKRAVVVCYHGTEEPQRTVWIEVGVTGARSCG